MLSLFKLLFRACASLGVLLLLNGVYINGFWISMIVGLLCGFIGYRFSSRFEFREYFSGLTMEFILHVGAMLIVLTALDVLLGAVLIVDRNALMTAVLSLALLHTATSRILGR